ncbi:hypothetical protein GJAV_G00269540 [Gymnothorax javanicus]|nr:hypothetical protein GJAV_G00269540 [Gymnothorax javanicus]
MNDPADKYKANHRHKVIQFLSLSLAPKPYPTQRETSPCSILKHCILGFEGYHRSHEFVLTQTPLPSSTLDLMEDGAGPQLPGQCDTAQLAGPIFVIADMGQTQSKRISAQSKKNQKRSEEVEVPVEDWGSDSERWSTVVQLSEQRLDEVEMSLEDIMNEFEGSGAELQEKAQMEQKVAALESRTLELEEAAQAISAEKADCEQKLASLSEMIDKLVLDEAEEKAEYEQRLAAMSETIEKRVVERTEIQKAECELKLAGISEIIAMLVLEKTEMQMEATIELNAGIKAEPIDLSIQATAEREAQMDHNLPALEGRDQMPQEIFLSKERTHMDIKAHAVEKRTTVLVQAAQAISEESMEFRHKSAATPDTTDLRILTRTQTPKKAG